MRQALANSAVLGDAMPGDSWRAWRVVLIACAGEKLTPSERKVWRKLTGRAREPGKLVSVFACIAGRRSGKTKAAAVFIVWLCLCVDWSDSLSLGEQGVALFLSPIERQAEIAHGYCMAIIDHVELFKAQVANRTASTIELHNGIVLRTEAANWRHNRGVTAVAIVMDESSFFRGEDTANSDQEIVRALKPSLATTQGPLLLTSSPGIEEGVTYRIWERHYGAKGDARTVVVHSDSLGLNPTLAKAVVDRAFEEDATSAEAEYGGRFRSPISNYLERSLVMQAVQPGLTLKAVLPGIRYFGHVDVAGGNGKDSFAAAVGHVVMDPGGRPVVCFDALFEIRPKFDPDDAVRRCTELMKLYGITTVYADGYAGNWPITGFAKYGVSYQICPLSASEIYLHSLPSWTASPVQLSTISGRSTSSRRCAGSRHRAAANGSTIRAAVTTIWRS